MNLTMTIATVLFILSSLIMMVASVLSKKSIIDREKMTPFECGFDPFNVARIPFSLKFFLIAMIFLIFDVEIAIILPAAMTFNNSEPIQWTYTLAIFIVVLLMGLYYEWKQGALEWTS